MSMNYPKTPNFGPVVDEQRDFWQRSKLAQRDAQIIDNHFNLRSHGQRIEFKNNYAIPKSMKVALKETKAGGLPVWDGANQTWNPRYAEAQSRLIQQNYEVPNARGMNEEIDAGKLMQQRLLSQAATMPSVQHGPMPGNAMVNGMQQNQQIARTCFLAEGHQFFLPLETQGFGSTQVMAKKGGVLQGIQGRQFKLEEQVSAYVIDGLQTIDLSRMEPSRLLTLVRVSQPGQRPFLVPLQAVQEATNGRPERQLLIDSGQQHRIEQRQQWVNQPQRGPMLPQPQQRQVVQPMQAPQNTLEAQSRALLARRGLLRG